MLFVSPNLSHDSPTLFAGDKCFQAFTCKVALEAFIIWAFLVGNKAVITPSE